jgi:hypothetical protein
VTASVVTVLLSLGFVLGPLAPGVEGSRRLESPSLRRSSLAIIALAAGAASLRILAVCPHGDGGTLLTLTRTSHVVLVVALVALTLVAGAVDAFAPRASSLAMWVGPVAGFAAILPLLLEGVELTEPVGAGLIGLGLGFGLGAIARASASVALRHWTGGSERPFEGL